MNHFRIVDKPTFVVIGKKPGFLVNTMICWVNFGINARRKSYLKPLIPLEENKRVNIPSVLYLEFYV